jgi:hypothetical protein
MDGDEERVKADPEMQALVAAHEQAMAAIDARLEAVRAAFAEEDALMTPGEAALKELFDARRDLETAEAMLADQQAAHARQHEKNDANMRILRDEMFRTQRALSGSEPR